MNYNNINMFNECLKRALVTAGCITVGVMIINAVCNDNTEDQNNDQ